MRSRLSLSVLAFVFTQVAWAQIEEFRVNTYTVGSQSLPSVAMDPEGNFIVVWQSSGQDGSDLGIFGQRYDGEGATLGPEFQVNSYTTGKQARPSAAVDDAGRTVVVWQSSGQDGSDLGIFGQRFDAEGNPLGAEFQVNSYTSGSQDMPDVAMDDEGRFVVVWVSDDPGPLRSRVRGRRFEADGSPISGDFEVKFGTGHGYYEAYHPAVATGGDGRFVVAWRRSWYQDSVVVRYFPSSGPSCYRQVAVPAALTFDPPDVEMAPSGDYVVAYSDGDDGVRARRFQGCSPFSGEIAVSEGSSPSVAGDASGNFTVTWLSAGDGSGTGIFARRFDGQGQSLGGEFLVNSFTSGDQRDPAIAMNGSGRSILAWNSSDQDGSGLGVYGRRMGAVGSVGVSVDRNPAASNGSNLNGLLEPGETVRIEPEWQNRLQSQLELTGVASNLHGPPGPSYELTDGSADYGSIPSGSSGDCAETTGDCYEVSIAGPRPADHWDVFLEEALTTGDLETWTLHVAESFADVPVSHGFYAYVENLLHNGVTGGCAIGSYCPDEPVRRDHMAVFLLKARYGSSYVPPPCAGVFLDVPCPGPFADWVERLLVEGITGGCGGSNYCPSSPVTRAQMAAFLLKAKYGSGYTPPACNGFFSDVPCPSPFADWIEQLFHESITAGCGGTNYCPNDSSTRGQMAAFLVKAFGLRLYGP